MDIKVIKKDGLEEDYDFNKIRTAVGKSARRACVELDDEDYVGLESHFRKKLRGMESVSVAKLHDYVESILLKRFPEVGNSYKEYRDFKKNAADALDDLYQQSKDTLYIGDRENANFNSSLTSTKGSLMGGYLRKQIYKDYYMTKEEKEATKEGYIYIHDQNNLFLGCHNCMTGDSWVTVKADGIGTKTVQLDDFDDLFDAGYGLTDTRDRDIEVRSKSGFVKLNGISRRKASDFENIFTITTEFGTHLRCTAEHIIPVYKKNSDEYKEIKAKDIREGDSLILDIKNYTYLNEKSIPSAPKELQKSAFITDTIGIERWIYAQYGYSILDAMDKAGIENLNTVEDYLKLKKVFPIPYFVENELQLSFNSGKKFHYNITNIYEFALEGGWYLTNGKPKSDKYPVEILDIYFHEKIPSFVYDGSMTTKYAFLYGCFENFMNRRDIQHLWGHRNININKDFYSIIKSLKIGGSVTETIRYTDETGAERILYTFRILDKRNHLALMNSCISAYNASRYFKETEPERIRTKVISITKTHENCDVYDLETGDHYFICNGYVVHNCLSSDSMITLRVDGVIKYVRFQDMELEYGITDFSEKNIEILSKSGFVKLYGVSKRKLKTEENEELFKMITNYGTSLRATANHRVPVVRDGIELLLNVSDICVGDELIENKYTVTDDNGIVNFLEELKEYEDELVIRNIDKLNSYLGSERFVSDDFISVAEYKKLKEEKEIPQDIENELLIGLIKSDACLPLRIPVTPNLSYVFGCMFGDGSIRKRNAHYSSVFCNTRDDVIESVGDNIKECFGDVLQMSKTIGGTSPCTILRFKNSLLSRWLYKYKTFSDDMSIPSFIMSGNENVKWAFVDGYTVTDGNIGKNQIRWNTVCKTFAVEFLNLLISLGISPTVSLDNKPSTKNRKPFSTVRISNQYDVRNCVSHMSNYKTYDFVGWNFGSNIRKKSKIKEIVRYTDNTDVYDVQTEDGLLICDGFLCHNCMLFDIQSVLKGGFKMADIEYTEPKTFLSACQVIGDITLSATAAQYGGFTLAEIDKVLVPYARKSILKHLRDARRWKIKDREAYACDRVREEMRQGLQSLEVKLNTITSSRGDTAFVTFSFGCVDGKKKLDNYLQREICKQILETRYNGQGKNGIHVVFPKLVYIYSKEQHKNKDQQELFDIGLKCTSKCMYPDFLSIDSGHAGEMYKLTGKVVSPMGCRSYLGEYFDDVSNDYHFVGRGNVGVVSLNLPMIWKKSDGKRFYKDLDYYLELCHKFLQSRYQYISEMPCSTNPLCFCEGGVLNGHKKPYEKIGIDILKSFSASLGITALNELNVLMEGKMLHESDQKQVTEVIDYILGHIKEWKNAEHLGYSIYATPAESLCQTQVQQFRKKFGVIEGVSDREYFTNGFHMHVTADITPYEKQDLEENLFHKIYGGHIQYVKLDNPKNIEATRKIIERAMEKGFYSGVNFTSVTCKDCGYHTDKEITRCPVCDSMNMIWISRISGYLGIRSSTTQKEDGSVVMTSRVNNGKAEEMRERISM